MGAMTETKTATTSETLELIRRYDRPGPRYTSYPTAVEFHEGVDAAVYGQHLDRASKSAEPLSLYFHLPFCSERCLYCGCNVVITRKSEVLRVYLEALRREIAAVAERLGSRRRLRQYHWGGGTPTYLSPREMAELHTVVRQHFDFEDGAELAVEIDPRVTTVEHLQQLRELGFNRLSMGVQDFTPEVQEIVHRVQPYEETRQLLQAARGLGFDSVNVDLIYGLPLQTLASFSDTLDKVLELRPERVAVYSYAHMPWLKVQQRQIPEDTLPTPEVKLRLITAALDQLRGGGYRAIGMDHFALPTDEMGKAVEDGTLWRNFMGYTVRHAPDVVACGMSGIGDVGGAYFQNQRKLKRYEDAVADPSTGGLAVERGVVLSPEDQLRRHVITALMCTFHLDLPEIGERFRIDPAVTFAAEWEALKGLEDDGLVRLRDQVVEVTPLGRIFVRNIAMVFDQYLKTPEVGDRRFSRTV